MMADDLYIGGDTVNELLVYWSKVLQRMQENNISLSPSKRVIGPKCTTILGVNLELWETICRRS